MRKSEQLDAPLWEALEQSALGRFTTAVSRPFAAAARTSRAIAAWQPVQEQWRALPAHDRMQAVGIIVTIAVLVHLGLATLRQPTGYWWLIVPGTALMFGLTAIVLSRLGRSAR